MESTLPKISYKYIFWLNPCEKSRWVTWDFPHWKCQRSLHSQESEVLIWDHGEGALKGKHLKTIFLSPLLPPPPPSPTPPYAHIPGILKWHHYAPCPGLENRVSSCLTRFSLQWFYQPRYKIFKLGPSEWNISRPTLKQCWQPLWWYRVIF